MDERVYLIVQGEGPLGAKLRFHASTKSVTLHGWDCDDGLLKQAIDALGSSAPFVPVPSPSHARIGCPPFDLRPTRTWAIEWCR
jgi:hypothetical protein